MPASSSLPSFPSPRGGSQPRAARPRWGCQNPAPAPANNLPPAPLNTSARPPSVTAAGLAAALCLILRGLHFSLVYCCLMAAATQTPYGGEQPWNEQPSGADTTPTNSSGRTMQMVRTGGRQTRAEADVAADAAAARSPRSPRLFSAPVVVCNICCCRRYCTGQIKHKEAADHRQCHRHHRKSVHHGRQRRCVSRNAPPRHSESFSIVLSTSSCVHLAR